MEFDGVVRNPQTRCHFFVSKSLRQQAKNFDLAPGKFFDQIEVGVGRALRTCSEEIANDFGLQQEQASSGCMNSGMDFCRSGISRQNP